MNWIIKAILSALSTEEVKELIIWALEKLVNSTDTELDNKALKIIKAILNESEEEAKKKRSKK